MYLFSPSWLGSFENSLPTWARHSSVPRYCTDMFEYVPSSPAIRSGLSNFVFRLTICVSAKYQLYTYAFLYHSFLVKIEAFRPFLHFFRFQPSENITTSKMMFKRHFKAKIQLLAKCQLKFYLTFLNVYKSIQTI